jgi:peptide/nickel transport system permease protein
MASTRNTDFAERTQFTSEVIPPFQGATRRISARKKLPKNLLLGIMLVGLILLSAILSLVLSTDPDLIHSSARLATPTFEFPFGTDQLGRDVFSRVLRGAQFALRLSVSATLLSVLAGVTLGLLSGYQAGWLDAILSRLMDGLMAFPGLLLAIVLAARLGPSLQTTILALGIMGVPSFFRITRSGTFTIKNAGYVLSSRSIGASRMRILLRHILPNLSSTLLVFITLRLGTMVLAGSGLSFIGLGVQPPNADWGAMLASSKSLLGRAWWLAVFPGLAITMTVLGFNMLGDGLRDYSSIE